MIHPDEENSQGKYGKKSSILMAILLVFVVVAVVFFAYLKNSDIDIRELSLQQLFPGNDSEQKLLQNTYEIVYDSKDHPVFCAYKDYIVKCSKDGVWFLDKKGREVWSLGVPFNKPAVKTNGRLVLVADLEGRDVYVLDGKSVFWNEKTEENIINAEMNENGYVTVITASQHYNGEVRVFDNRGIELFRRVIANEFAVTAKINSYQKQMLVSLVNPSGVKSNMYFEFYNLDDPKDEDVVKKQMPQDKGLYPLVWFTGSGSVFAAGDKSVLYIDKDRSIKWEKSFSKVTSACITSGKRLAAAIESDGKDELKIFSMSGEEYSSIALNTAAINISSAGGVIAVNSVQQVDFYTDRCRGVGRYISKSDIENVLFFSKSQAAIITKTYIVLVDI